MAEVLGILGSVLQLVDVVATLGIYLKDLRNAPVEQRKLFSELQVLKPLLEDLYTRISRNRASVRTPLVRQLEEPLNQLARIFKHTSDKVDRAHGNRLTRRVNWSLWDKKQVDADLDEIERFKALLNSWLALNTWDIGQHEEREKIIQWFSPLNFFPQQDALFATRQRGTGEWLLNTSEFKEWKSTMGATLWCYGMPGAGKTVLASLVVDHLNQEANIQREELQTQSFGVACVYCNHKETSAQTCLNLISALWRQLVHGQSISGYVWDLYQRHYERHTRPTMEEVLAALRSALACHTMTYFVIDGLDEYTADEGNARFVFLARLRSLGPTLNVMFTSRPHIDVHAAFPCSLRLEIRADDDDVRQYVQAQIAHSPRLANHATTRPELRQEIENELVHRAEGMFLLVKLHVESLQTKNTVRAVRQALKSLPDNLNHTYDAVLRRIDSQNEDNKHLANQVLLWISNAKRPLSISELQEALAIEPGTRALDTDNLVDVEIILSVCGGLVIVDWPNQNFRLVHHTTQSYLDRVRAQRFPDAQTVITAACLTYLSFDIFANPSQHHRYRKYKGYSFLRYAAEYCLVHAHGKPEFLLKENIIEFLGHATHWKLFSSHEYWPHSASKLWVAASFNLCEIVSQLLTRTTGGNAKQAGNPLYAAANGGFLEMVHLLLERGANVDERGGIFGTALQVAAAHGHNAVIQVLLEYGADVNIQGGIHGTALHAASFKGHEQTVILLIENGADVNAEGGEFGTALHAASCGHLKVAQRLLEHGAAVDTLISMSGTALHTASMVGHEAVVKLLIEHGADVNAPNSPQPPAEFGTAIQAASFHGHIAVVQLLLENDADVNAMPGLEGTALQAACVKGHHAIVDLLLRSGAAIDAQGGEFGTALRAAAMKGHKSVVRLLVEGGANLDVQGGGWRLECGLSTALQAASAIGNEELVQILIEGGANVNIAEGRYGTALHAASYRGHKRVVALLLASGAENTVIA